MSPPGQRSGPRTPTRAAQVAEVTTTTDASILQRPRVRGVVLVSLARAVDELGWLGGDAARRAAWALGDVPKGMSARVDLGQARTVDPSLAGCLLEYGAHLEEIEVTGADPAAVIVLMRGMNPSTVPPVEGDTLLPAPGLRGVADSPTFAELCERRGQPERATRARARSDSWRSGL